MAESADGCIFCRIAAGEVPAEIVYEDHWVVAFRDANPKAPTHVLVIPRRHLASAADLESRDTELMGAFFTAFGEIARSEGLAGYRLISNVGAEAGQSVFHLHFHLLGGRSMSWPPG